MAVLKIGRMFATGVDNLAEAVNIYCRVRDASDEGASTFPIGKYTGTVPIRPATKKTSASLGLKSVTYTISYNGRVWDAAGQTVAY